MVSFFPVSVWYGPERSRAPMVPTKISLEKVHEDLITIKKLGFNSVRFWYDWATAEPNCDTWDFSVIDELLSSADKVGMKAIVQVYTDSAPNWVEAEFPDSVFVDRSGLVIHSQASPGYCSDHPVIRQHIGEFLKRLSKVVSSHESFYAWDIWSEPHIVQWSWIDYIKDPWFCYCKHSEVRFIEWLKSKYEDIEVLNQAWYRKHRSWEEVTAPRYVSLSSFKDLLDWIQFNIEKIATDLEWKVNMIRENDKNHPISSHAAISSVYGIPGVGYGASDDWKLAEKVDIWGTSFYPKHTGSWMPLRPHQMGVALDASRSSCESRKKIFWIGELQTGHGVTGLRFGEPVDELDVERWAWFAVSRNAKGLNYYAWLPMSCGYEVSGFGLANYDGSVNERAMRAGLVAKIITENMKLFLECEPLPAQVAILYNVEAHKSLACLRAESADIIRKEIFGMYKAFKGFGANVDFLHVSDLKPEVLRKYKLIALPFSIAFNSSSAEALKRYVQDGGNILASGRIAWFTEEGLLCEKIPGFGLDELFGCEEIWTMEVRQPIEVELFGMRALASKYLSSYKLNTGKSVGSCGDQIIAVENEYHKGKAYIIGTLLGVGFEEFARQENLEPFRKITDLSGVRPDYQLEFLSDAEDEIEVSISKSANAVILFIFNHGKTMSKFNLYLPLEVLPKIDGKVTILNESESACNLARIRSERFLIIKNIEIDHGRTLVIAIE